MVSYFYLQFCINHTKDLLPNLYKIKLLEQKYNGKSPPTEIPLPISLNSSIIPL